MMCQANESIPVPGLSGPESGPDPGLGSQCELDLTFDLVVYQERDRGKRAIRGTKKLHVFQTQSMIIRRSSRSIEPNTSPYF